MENEIMDFYDGSNARPVQVRVLLFNDAFNIYESATDNFIYSFSVKGATTNLVGENYFIYPANHEAYLQLKAGDPLAEEISRQVDNANKNIVSRMLRHRAFSLLLITIALVAGLYFGLISLVPYLGSKMISTPAEIRIGKNLKEIMLKQELAMGATIDTAGTHKLQDFARKLKFSDKYPLNITLIKSKTVNAYAIPGGEIVVYTGILDKMDSYEVLVALLAHESSHVNKRHTLRSLLRSAANGILISVLLSDPTGVSGVLAGNAENLNGLRYSRSLETEADIEGMKLMLANNVDLNGMKRLMELLKTEGDMPGSLAFLSSHPLTTERIKIAEEFIKNNSSAAGSREDLRSLFQSLKHSK